MNTYKVEKEFIHILSKVKMYRVKRFYPSGGIDYIVCTKEKLDFLKLCENH